jgi:hypothetical protein
MRRRFLFARALAAATLLTAGMACAAADPPAIDPGTMSALQKMGVYLRSLTAYQVIASTTDEDVLEDGQKIQYSGTTTLLARKPDRLRAEVTDDRHQRLFLYDGKSFTLFAQRAGYYATVAAPPTIGQLADKLDAAYDFTVPLQDLFRWGATGWDGSAIKEAMDVGPSEVDGVTCEQYALRQEDIDWQIWVQRGDYPLPRKIVITTRTDEARPQHSAIYAWNLAPSYNESAFKFVAPADAHRVVFPGSVPAAGSAQTPPATK